MGAYLALGLGVMKSVALGAYLSCLSEGKGGDDFGVVPDVEASSDVASRQELMTLPLEESCGSSPDSADTPPPVMFFLFLLLHLQQL